MNNKKIFFKFILGFFYWYWWCYIWLVRVQNLIWEFMQILVSWTLSRREFGVPKVTEYSLVSIWNWGENGNFYILIIIYVFNHVISICVIFNWIFILVKGYDFLNYVLLVVYLHPEFFFFNENFIEIYITSKFCFTWFLLRHANKCLKATV
jgi:hypothetical protein